MTLTEQRELIFPNNHTTTFEEFEALYIMLHNRVWRVKGKEYHLPSLGWARKYNTHEAYGRCAYRYKRINRNHYKLTKRIGVFISKDMLLSNLDKANDFEDTIRHEIAHAIDCEIRGHSNHDKHWKAVAFDLGAKPQRLSDESMYKDKTYKYTLTCPHCGETYQRSRMSEGRTYSCAECAPKGYDEKYKLDVVQNY